LYEVVPPSPQEVGWKVQLE
jgi:hypothetical protein